MEITEMPADTACWNCKRKISSLDSYCRYCGKGQGEKVPWYYGHAGIIVITLFGLGPFSLGLVWKSPKLSREAKATYTVVILAFTWYVATVLYRAYVNINAMVLGNLNNLGI